MPNWTELSDIVAALMLPDVEGSARRSRSPLALDVERAEQAFLKFSSPVTGSIEAQQFNMSDLRLALNATGEKLPGKSIDSELKGEVRQTSAGRTSRPNGRRAAKPDQGQVRGEELQRADDPLRSGDRPVRRRSLPAAEDCCDKEKDKSKQAEPEQPFDLSALKTLNLEGSVRIGALKAANVKVAQLRVDVKAKNGLVNIAPLSARLYKGSMDGKVSVNAATNSFTVNEKLTGIEIAPLVKDAADLELVEGKGNVVLDLTTTGNTVSGLKKALNGNASVNLANGAIKGIDLAKLVQGIQSLSKSTTTQTLGVDKNEKTDFSEFKASFKIKNGVAHNDDLAVKSTVLRITGNGDIDIGRDSINYNAKAIFAKTEQGRTGTLPVNVYGPFDDLKFKVDYAALLTDVAKQKLDEKKEQVREDAKAKMQEELRKGLKGLFK
jgi:AsmA protein